MGTRSVITTNPEALGRYVHWDGYPTGVGLALLAIVKRDGIDKARTVLTREHFGWSSVDAEPNVGEDVGDPDRFEWVPGYGKAYTHTEHHDAWAQEVDSEEYGYILGDTHLTVLDVYSERSLTVAYDDPEAVAKVKAFDGGEE